MLPVQVIGVGLAGVGEAATLEAKEFGLKQGFGDGGAVDVDEGALTAEPVAVDQTREETLTGAGVALQNDGSEPPTRDDQGVG